MEIRGFAVKHLLQMAVILWSSRGTVSVDEKVEGKVVRGKTVGTEKRANAIWLEYNCLKCPID